MSARSTPAVAPPRRLRWALLLLAAAATPALAQTRVLRYALPVAETSFDPAQISDLYSRTIAAGIFEAPLEFAFMAEPARLRPNTAAEMPEVSADFRRFTFRIKPGIHFAADPAFGGRPRELTAADYVYSIKRHYDPRWKSANLFVFEAAKILGLGELRRRALEHKQPFDYDTEVEGLRTLDRYRFEIRLAAPSPRFLNYFADGSFTGALAREVVERWGDRVGEHPVGTGPFVLGAWKRSSRIELARNPGYRDVRYAEQPPPGDARRAAAAAALRGRRLPLVDQVQIAIIEEQQPRWLSFLNGEQDVMENLPPEFIDVAVPNGRLAPNLARRGIGMLRYARADVTVTYFAMENPVVGGYAPENVALRRAIALGTDVGREIRLLRHGQAIPAQSIVGPQTWGYDPAFKSEMSDYSPQRARALLDLYGYVDRDGDGWRERPDGSALVLQYATQPDQQARRASELWKRNMDALGLRIEFSIAQWPEQLKASRAGKLMLWGVGWSAGAPDGETFLDLAYGPNKGQANHARFGLPAYDELYRRQAVLPDGRERQALFDEAKKLLIAYMPYKVHVHRIGTDLWQPWVIGYHRNLFVRDFWKYVDVDAAMQARGAP